MDSPASRKLPLSVIALAIAVGLLGPVSVWAFHIRPMPNELETYIAGLAVQSLNATPLRLVIPQGVAIILFPLWAWFILRRGKKAFCLCVILSCLSAVSLLPQLIRFGLGKTHFQGWDNLPYMILQFICFPVVPGLTLYVLIRYRSIFGQLYQFVGGQLKNRISG